MSGEGQDKNGDVAGEAEASVPLNNGAGEPKKNKNPNLASKFKALSIEKPPTKSPLEFLLGLLGLCCCLPAAACACGCLILGILMQLIPLAEIIVGAWYWPGSENCPKEEDIPLLLIIGGCIGILAGSVESIWGHKKIRERGGNKDGGKDPENQGDGDGEGEETPQKEAPLCIRLLASLLRLASLAWLIYSAVVVYRSYSEVNYDENHENYCHPALYRLLFWVVTLSVSLLLLMPVMACVACCVGGVCMAAGAAASD